MDKRRKKANQKSLIRDERGESDVAGLIGFGLILLVYNYKKKFKESFQDTISSIETPFKNSIPSEDQIPNKKRVPPWKLS